MLAIRGFPGRERVTIGELAERLQVLHHSAVGLVDRLAGQGLLQREQDIADRRAVYVSLTPLGEDMTLASARSFPKCCRHCRTGQAAKRSCMTCRMGRWVSVRICH